MFFKMGHKGTAFFWYAQIKNAFFGDFEQKQRKQNKNRENILMVTKNDEPIIYFIIKQKQ